jgi:hypothetical protein
MENIMSAILEQQLLDYSERIKDLECDISVLRTQLEGYDDLKASFTVLTDSLDIRGDQLEELRTKLIDTDNQFFKLQKLNEAQGERIKLLDAKLEFHKECIPSLKELDAMNEVTESGELGATHWARTLDSDDEYITHILDKSLSNSEDPD